MPVDERSARDLRAMARLADEDAQLTGLCALAHSPNARRGAGGVRPESGGQGDGARAAAAEVSTSMRRAAGSQVVRAAARVSGVTLR